MRARPTNNFRIRISSCGTDYEHFDYSTLKSRNSIILAQHALDQMADAWISDTGKSDFFYVLGCLLIYSHKPDKYSEMAIGAEIPDFNNDSEVLEQWRMRKREKPDIKKNKTMQKNKKTAKVI